MRKPQKPLPQGTLKFINRMSGENSPTSPRSHVTGKAVDDIPEPPNLVHVACGLSTIPSGVINSIDLDQVWSSEGVVDVITWEEVPGSNDVSPVYDGDKLLAEGRVSFGQPVCRPPIHLHLQKSMPKANRVRGGGAFFGCENGPRERGIRATYPNLQTRGCRRIVDVLKKSVRGRAIG